MKSHPLKRFILPACIPFALFSQTSSGGESYQSVSNNDLTAVAEAMKPIVYVLKQPVFTYHWVKAPNWQREMSASDPSGLEYAKRSANSFWQPELKGCGSTYGCALYVSQGPYATKSFGGFPEGNAYAGMSEPKSWVLLQLEFPSGFRYLDLRETFRKTVPLPEKAALKKIGCVLDSALGWDGLMQLSTGTRSKECSESMRKVFGILKLGGFAYGYSSSNLDDCRKNGDAAWVITSGESLAPARVKIFNRLTKDAVPDRARIQEIFHRSADFWLNPNQRLQVEIVKEYLKKEPNLEKRTRVDLLYQTMMGVCSSRGVFSTPVVASDLCRRDPSDFAWLIQNTYHHDPARDSFWEFARALLQAYYPQIKTRNQLTRFLNENPERPARKKTGIRLWADSDHLAPKEREVTQWMQQHLLDCGKEAQYQSLRDFESLPGQLAREVSPVSAASGF